VAVDDDGGWMEGGEGLKGRKKIIQLFRGKGKKKCRRVIIVKTKSIESKNKKKLFHWGNLQHVNVSAHAVRI